MMKLIVAICLFVVIVSSAPAPQDVQLLDFTNENDGTGNYKYSFSQSDGTKVQETGELKTVTGEEGPVEAVVKTGSYEFTDADGGVHRVTYTADETGFHPIVES
ncbi:larval cuticle protein 1-like [Episyrphus balteatus]|uniref:larval cuticle protein 1-like n=1 Tax=Episyrphus balteatus TaxID=286459 RepID=UPI0024865C36|nr:larval cuticle protein 1-like [Episyrphus balteatus]